MNYQSLDLTIVIPALNEECNLSACLQAIGTNFASRLAVIDSLSTDSTTDVAQRHGAEVVDFHWDGHFPKKRNWFLRLLSP